jgi:RHS repeat-associated protein
MRKINSAILKSIGLLGLILFTTGSWAQTYVTAPMTGTPAAGGYYNNSSITISPTFSFTASSGQSLEMFIAPLDCMPMPAAMSLNQNYVLTSTPRIGGITSETGLINLSSCQLSQTVKYSDGLGRPVQTIQVMGSPFGNDVVQPQAYDQYGREVTKYLPYTPQTGTAGSFRPNAVTTDQAAFYSAPPAGVSAITYPYAQTAFDNSPLSRPVEHGAPGVPWQLTGVTGGGHTVKMVYTVNNSTAFTTDSVNGRQVAMYYCTIGSNLNRTLVNNGYYATNTLTVTISKDENWVSGRAGTVEEYKDIDGHVVLKRQYNYATSVQVLSTYYVYDDLGKLAFVLPPASGADAAGAISQSTLNNLCYQYQYDELGRAIAKKLPGKGWEYTVYNTMDQPVATQDSLQRAANNWIFAKYDALGRPILSGIWNNGGTAISRASLQTILTGIVTNLFEAPQNSGNGYTNVAWPKTNATATLTTNFYDTYANIPGLPATYTLSSGVSLLTRSLPTVKKTAVLNTPADQLWDVMYYDDLGRITNAFTQHYLGGTANLNNYDHVTTTYNFTDQPTTVTRQHWNTASTTYPLVTVANTYLYDHVGRKLKTWEQITNGNSAPTTKTLISKIEYNEIGQVLTKHLHSTDSVNFYQNIAYTYNERGWLVTSSAPLFAMQLYYNTGTYPQYNGNIGNQYYGTQGNLNKYFTYTYDRLNRLTSGWNTDLNKEAGIGYDLMGNITALQRYTTGNTLIDNLTYTYTGNQLTTITDATTNDAGLKHGSWSFIYDGNGNQVTDPSKGTSGISIAYNLLNLPQSVTGGKTITYTYDASGNKLRRVSPNTGNTDYMGGIQYDGTTTSTLSFIQTEDGKAVPNGTGYDYTYYLGDNLGNTRVTFDTSTGAAVSQQADDYYPFGMEINRAVTSPKNEYLYNKKELQEELSEYDYGARFYDPVIARWNTIDPHAENSRRWSPYNYVVNNPIEYIDPDGMDYQNGIYENGLYGPTVTYMAGDNNTTTQNCAIAASAVANAITTGIKSAGGGVGNNVGPPKDGDKNLFGLIYSGTLKQWVTPQVFHAVYEIEERFRKKAEESDPKKVESAGTQTGASASKKIDFFGLPLIETTAVGMLLEKSNFLVVSSFGTKLGVATAGIGIGNDTYSLFHGKISLSAWSYNSAFNILGIKASPVGLSYSLGTYLYPGGIQGALADWHHIVYPGWTEYPTHRDFEGKK